MVPPRRDDNRIIFAPAQKFELRRGSRPQLLPQRKTIHAERSDELDLRADLKNGTSPASGPFRKLPWLRRLSLSS